MDNGEGDIAEIKELLKRQRDSHEGLKKTVTDTSSDLRVALAKLTGETRIVRWLLVFLVGLGLLNGVMRFFGH